MTVDEFTRLTWRVTHDAPVLRPPLGTPLIADPTFLPPDETPDGRWHLFAHSIFGVHHFTSEDGVRWSRSRLVVRHAMRALRLPRRRALPSLLRALSRVPPATRRRTRARLAVVDRATLVAPTCRHWSRPTVALTTDASVGIARKASARRSATRPCSAADRGWTLYYSAALVRVPDCGFNEPLHVGVAHGETIAGPYRPDPEPVLSPSSADPRANLGAGAMRVIQLDEGLIGLQNGIAWDPATRTSRSALSVRRSRRRTALGLRARRADRRAHARVAGALRLCLRRPPRAERALVPLLQRP